MSLLKTNEIQNYNGSSLTLTASTVSTSAQLNTGGNISVTGSLNVSDESTTRTNLGLGSMATQNLSLFIGMIAPFAMSSAPTGWLVCNGAEYAIADYGDLYTAIGTTWGALTNGSGGAGSTHFRVPDLRGAFLRGIGTGTINARSKVGPTNVGDFDEDAVEDHQHYSQQNASLYSSLTMYATSTGSFTTNPGLGNFTNTTVQHAIGSGEVGPMKSGRMTSGDTKPYNAGINYCIKY